VAAAFALLVAASSFAAPGDRIGRFAPRLASVFALSDEDPQLAMDGSGRFVATWVSQDIFNETSTVLVRRFAANGDPLAAEVVAASQRSRSAQYVGARVAMAGDGSFVVGWIDTNRAANQQALYVRRFGPYGAPRGPAVRVDETVPSEGGYSLATAADGHFVVTWDTREAGSSQTSPFARLYSASAAPQSAPFRVAAREIGGGSEAAMSAAGDFVVIFARHFPRALRGQRFNAAGEPLGGDFAVASESSTTGVPVGHKVAMSSAGAFVVAYAKTLNDPRYPHGFTSFGVYARRYDASARALGGEFLVSAKGVRQSRPGVAIDVNAAGDFAVSWLQSQRIDGGPLYLHNRLYRASGAAATADQGYNLKEQGSIHDGTSVALDGAGNFAVGFYLTARNPDDATRSGTNVYAQRYAGYNDTRPSCARYIPTIIGNGNANDLAGGPGADIIYAGPGNDTVHGWGGPDVICGAGGSDALYGGSGDDFILGGTGDDLLDGGAGAADYCNGETDNNADTAVGCELTDGIP
jgi:hypothetical protein